MDKYINATNLIKNIDAALAKTPPRGNGKSTDDVVVRAALGATKQMVQNELKIGEYRPVVHAHWMFKCGNYVCSNCGVRSYDKEDGEDFNLKYTVFCPYCGALMDEPEVDE